MLFSSVEVRDIAPEQSHVTCHMLHLLLHLPLRSGLRDRGNPHKFRRDLVSVLLAHQNFISALDSYAIVRRYTLAAINATAVLPCRLFTCDTKSVFVFQSPTLHGGSQCLVPRDF